MAISVITDQHQTPYSRIVKIEAHFSNGGVSVGSGVLVGRNDVLTASHVVYNSALGGLASQIFVMPGYDGDPTEDGSLAVLGRTPFGTYTVESATYSSLVDPDADGLIESGNFGAGLSGTERDVALLGLGVPIGDVLGYMVPKPVTSGAQAVHISGYPTDYSDLVDQTGTIIYNPVDYNFQTGQFDLRSGNSGGPIWYGNAIEQYVAGVVSTTGYGHDIGALFNTITSSILQNDVAISAGRFVGGEQNDVIWNTPGSALYDGKAGVDTFVTLGVRSAYNISGGIKLQSVTGEIDYVYNVERFRFNDGTLAFDADGNAGQAFRLYRAAFDRLPDFEGLGYWVAELDTELVDIVKVAQNFLLSAEFQQNYGTAQTVSDTAFISLLYANVLDRAPDFDGQAYWLAELARGFERERVLASFADSNENRTATATLIADGIWFI